VLKKDYGWIYNILSYLPGPVYSKVMVRGKGKGKGKGKDNSKVQRQR